MTVRGLIITLYKMGYRCSMDNWLLREGIDYINIKGLRGRLKEPTLEEINLIEMELPPYLNVVISRNIGKINIWKIQLKGKRI